MFLLNRLPIGNQPTQEGNTHRKKQAYVSAYITTRVQSLQQESNLYNKSPVFTITVQPYNSSALFRIIHGSLMKTFS